eukprot:9559912-Alexandrium_andersonii.AAC.1
MEVSAGVLVGFALGFGAARFFSGSVLSLVISVHRLVNDSRCSSVKYMYLSLPDMGSFWT